MGDSVELTIMNISSHRITEEFNFPADSVTCASRPTLSIFASSHGAAIDQLSPHRIGPRPEYIPSRLTGL
eukprot:388982-Prorocentrum_minimum.AAC.1